jgi:hypothetical protein
MTISPVNLRARREALRVSRELVASFCPSGTTAGIIKTLEKGSTHYVRPWHVAAIEQLERWFHRDSYGVEAEIRTLAQASAINEHPVLWFMSEPAFKRSRFFESCLGCVELYTVCLMGVREELTTPIEAEMLPSKYDAFREELGITSDHPEVWAKWWRHWSKQYRLED